MLVVYPSVYDEKIFHVDVSLREEYRKKFTLKERVGYFWIGE